MNIRGNVVLRAGITWGIVAVILAVLAAVFAPILPQVSRAYAATCFNRPSAVGYQARWRAYSWSSCG